MSVSASVAEKISKLLRLLASDSDGEVVAAARALNRTPREGGTDIHALADKVTSRAKFTEEDAHEIYQRGREDGRHEAERSGRFTAVVEPPWLAIAEDCKARIRLLGPREQKFVDDMVLWLSTPDSRPTDRQAAWLRSIYVRVMRQ
jgi:hypothetical protein